jgi:hypothetical protein
MTPLSIHTEMAVPAPPPGFRGADIGLEQTDATTSIPSILAGHDDLHDDRLHLDLPD